jgi:hypothetical protein
MEFFIQLMNKRNFFSNEKYEIFISKKWRRKRKKIIIIIIFMIAQLIKRKRNVHKACKRKRERECAVK